MGVGSGLIVGRRVDDAYNMGVNSTVGGVLDPEIAIFEIRAQARCPFRRFGVVISKFIFSCCHDGWLPVGWLGDHTTKLEN